MYSRNKEKTAGWQPCCFILPYIHIPILKQNRPVLFFKSTIHTFLNQYTPVLFLKSTIHTFLKLVHTCSIFQDTIYTFLKLVHACSIFQVHHTYLPKISTRLFYFLEAPYIPFLNQYTPVLFFKSPIITYQKGSRFCDLLPFSHFPSL